MIRQVSHTAEEIAARARAIYEERIRAQVEPHHRGKYLAIDVETGDYEIDADDFAAMQRAYEKHPGGTLYAMRIGHRTAGQIGAPGVLSKR